MKNKKEVWIGLIILIVLIVIIIGIRKMSNSDGELSFTNLTNVYVATRRRKGKFLGR